MPNKRFSTPRPRASTPAPVRARASRPAVPPPSLRAFELARKYRAFARQLEDYVAARRTTLQPGELFQLLGLVEAQYQAASMASWAGARLDLAAMAAAAREVDKATATMLTVLDRLDTVEDVLKAVGSALGLVTSLVRGEPTGIASSAKTLGKDLLALRR